MFLFKLLLLAFCLLFQWTAEAGSAKAAAAKRSLQFVRSPRDLLAASTGAVLIPSSQDPQDVNSCVERLVDGRIDTAYRSAPQTFPNWVEIRWPQTAVVEGVRMMIRGSENQPEYVCISGRLPGGEWIELKTLTSPADYGSIQTFPRTECTRLKLHFGASSSGHTEIRELEVLGEAPRRLFAKPTWKGEFIWYPEANVDNVTRYFRRHFQIAEPAEVQSALLQICADDNWQGFCNGKSIGGGGLFPCVMDLKLMLRAGDNVLSFQVQDFTIDEGLLFELAVITKDGARMTIVSDENVLCSRESGTNWFDMKYSDDHWQKARPSGRSKASVLYQEEKLLEEIIEWRHCELPVAAKPGERVEVRLHLTVPRKLYDNLGFRVSLGELPVRGDANYWVAEVDLMPPVPTAKWVQGKEYVLPVSLYIPEWAPDGEMPLHVAAIAPHGSVLLPPPPGDRLDIQKFAERRSPSPSRLAKAELRQSGDGPKLLVNGKIVAPFIMTDSSEPDSLQVIGAHAACKAPIVRVDVSSDFYGVDADECERKLTSSVAALDQYVEMRLRVNPDAWLLLATSIYPRVDWNRRNPDECTQLPDGTRFNHSFSSEKFIAESEAGIKALIARISTRPYASRIIGFHFGIGDGPETYYWGASSNRPQTERNELQFGDFSFAAQKAFGKWLRAHYRNNVEVLRAAWKRSAVTFENAIPEIDELRRQDSPVFRDPSNGRMAMDFWTFQSDAVATTALRLARAIKDASGGNWLCGLWGFYNVSINHCSGSIGYGHHIGYTGLAAVLDSPDIDYLAAIQGYAGIGNGTPVISLFTYDSLRRRGKLFLEEYDLRTFFTDLTFSASHHFSQFETHQMIKRDFGKSIAHDQACWWVGFSHGYEGRRAVGWYDDESIAALMSYCARVREATVQYPFERTADVGVFVNDRDVTAMDVVTADPVLVSTRFNFLVEALASMGVSFELNSMQDFSPKTIDCYKVLIFLDSYVLETKIRQTIRQTLDNGGKSAIWFYAPGIVDPEQGLSPLHITELTGFTLTHTPEPLSGAALQVILDGEDPMLATARGITFQPRGYLFAQRPLTLGPVFSIQDPQATILGHYVASGKPAVAIKRCAGRRDLYSAVPDLPRQLLREFLKEAKVHFYTETPVFMEAGNRFISLHAGSNGYHEKVNLPKTACVYDIFRQRILPGGELQEFLPLLAPFESQLFFLGNDIEVTALDQQLRTSCGILPQVPLLTSPAISKDTVRYTSEPVLHPVEKSEWTGDVGHLIESSEGTEDEFILRVQGSAFLFSSEILPVDPSKNYRLSGRFRQGKNSAQSIFFFGVLPFDGAGQVIKPTEVQAIPDTETILLEEAKAGTQRLKIKDASSWKATPEHCVAFEVDPSGEFRDLPNRKVTRPGILSIKAERDGALVTLAYPLSRDYAAGTAVRQHGVSAEFIYCGAIGSTLQEGWTLIKGNIGGEPQYGIRSAAQWWRGTRGAKIVLLMNYAGDKQHIGEFQDVILEPIQSVRTAH